MDPLGHDMAQIIPKSDFASVRKRPGMYLGSETNAGNQVVRELVSNALDQHLQGFVTAISVTTSEELVRVSDDGPGLLFHPHALDYLTKLHFTASATGHAPHVHLGLHGVGLAALNALGARMSVESWRDGEGRAVTFERGELTTREANLAGKKPDGTTVEWHFDHSFWAPAPADGRARRDLFDAAHLYPGLILGLNGERFCAPGGLVDYCGFHRAPSSWGWDTSRSFQARATVDDVRVQVAGFVQSKRDDELVVVGFANGVRNDTGDHMDGVRRACRGLSGICAVSVIMEDPEYAGPTRKSLKVPRVRKIVQDVVRTALESK